MKQSQDEAHLGCQRFQGSNPEWAWKFRILEAESLLLRGMSRESLALLHSQPIAPVAKDVVIEMLAIEGVAYARVRSFPDADRSLNRAEQLCAVTADSVCGKVIRARGVLALERGQPQEAARLFAESLAFAHAHADRFLEASALLNLGAYALKEHHFDEAIGWLEPARALSTNLGAESIALKAVGNLGWAYYNLGDSEKALALSNEAEQRAVGIGDVFDQLSWINNAGYVYADLHDLPRAKQAYLQAYGFAKTIDSKDDIYNALRALALVSVESDDLGAAGNYATEALELAHGGNNRRDELYPLLVNGLIAARAHDGSHAERIFHEVERDSHADASLKWRSQHALATLYEDENRPEAADREYQIALSTFEGARATLLRKESILPFSANAVRIYDDYIHFLVARGKTTQALSWAEHSRARTLAEGLRLLPGGAPAGPPPLNAQEIARRLQGTLLFYWLGDKQSYLWAVTAQKVSLFPLPSGAEIGAAVERYRSTLTGPQDALSSADPDGTSLYRILIAPAKELLAKDARVYIIPDGPLNNLNFETLPVPEPTPHYWIEDATISNASSLRMLAASRTVEKRQLRKLLLIGNSVPPSEKYPALPRAGAQMESVARHFSPDQQKILSGAQATSDAYLHSNPEQYSFIHFVAHGTASRLSPLDSAIVLSKNSAADDSFKLYARDIMQHPLKAKLVTISACYGSGERSYAGEGLVGLSWAFLGSGAHNVIAALWEATDASTEQLMGTFYDELDKGAPLDAALRAAKLSLLRGRFHNPFYWAPFQLYTGS